MVLHRLYDDTDDMIHVWWWGHEDKMVLWGSCDMMPRGQGEHEETTWLNCDIKHGLWKNSLVAIVIVILLFCVKRKVKMQKRHPMAFAEAYISMIVRLWSAAQKMCVDCRLLCKFFFLRVQISLLFQVLSFFRVLRLGSSQTLDFEKMAAQWRMFSRRMSGNSSRPAVQQRHVIVTPQFGAPLLMGCKSSEGTATVITSDYLRFLRSEGEGEVHLMDLFDPYRFI